MAVISGSRIAITNSDVLDEFFKDTNNPAKTRYDDIKKNKPNAVVNFFNNDAQVGWSDVLNWIQNEDSNGDQILSSGCEILFSRHTYILKNNIVCNRGDELGFYAKYRINIIGSSNKSGTTTTTFQFADNVGGIGWYFHKQVTILNCNFIGNDNLDAIVKIFVRQPDDSNGNVTYDADTDSRIENCGFQKFPNKLALSYGGRNCKVFGCDFKSAGKDSTAISHFFRNTKESDGGRGENRKNTIKDCTFDLNIQAVAIHLGVELSTPDEELNPDNDDYEDYQGFLIINNRIFSGRLLKIVGGNVTNDDNTVVRQKVTASVNSNQVFEDEEGDANVKKRAAIDIEDCILDINLGDLVFTAKKANHAIFIDENVAIENLQLTATLDGFNKEAIILPSGTDSNSVSLVGVISNSNSNLAGKNGVADTNGNKLAGFFSNYMASSTSDLAVPINWYAPNVPEAPDKSLTTGAIDLNDLWENGKEFDLKNKWKITKQRKGEEAEEENWKDYTAVFRFIGRPDSEWTEEQRKWKSDTYTLSKRGFIRKASLLPGEDTISINRPLTIAGPNNTGERKTLNMDDFDDRYPLTINSRCVFQNIAFDSTGRDGQDFKDNYTQHPYLNKPGCNHLDIRSGGGTTKILDCGFGGHKNCTAVRWDVAGNGRVRIFDTNFKDATGSVQLQIHATSNQNSGLTNAFCNNLIHTSQKSTMMLVGDFNDISGSRDIADITVANTMMDIGGYLLGINTNNDIGDVVLTSIEASGGFKVDESIDLDACIHCISGTVNLLSITNCKFSTDKEITNGLDYIILDKEFNFRKGNNDNQGFRFLASSCNVLGKNKQNVPLIMHSSVFEGDKAKDAISLSTIFAGNVTKASGKNGVRYFDDSTTIDQSKRIPDSDTDQFNLFQLSGKTNN